MTVSTLAILSLSLLLTGCQLPYLVSGAVEQVKILGSRKKIEKAIENVALTDQAKAKLKYALKAKDFAAQNGLNCKKNFESFVQLDRPYVSYLVIASQKNEVKAKKWSFPIVGSFPYKGFFSEKQALHTVSNLKKKNYDTYMRGVTAYSSLGWFKEPILSSMLKYDQEALAETIFHECFHRTFFVKNKTEKNEQLAVFIGHHYLLAFLKEQNEIKKVEREKTSWKEQRAFTKFLEQSLKKADSFYKNKKEDKNRALLFSGIQESYKKDLKPILSVNNYDSVFLKELNNAKLAAFKTYFHKFEALEALLKEKYNGNPVSLVEDLSKIKRTKKQLLFLRSNKIM